MCDLGGIGSNSSEAKASWSQRRRRFNKAMRWVRRAHMYLGLVLLPWVFLFGLSGFLFNHNDQLFGGAVEVVAEIDAHHVRDVSGFELTTTETLAGQVVSGLNRLSHSEGGYRLIPGTASVLGDITYAWKTENESVRASIGLETGRVRIVQIHASPKTETNPPFHGEELAVPSVDHDQLKAHMKRILKDRGVLLSEPLELSGRSAKIRLQIEDDLGTRWNAVYDFVSGKVLARGADDSSGMNFRDIVTRLHKTHNYPERFGVRWMWIALADVTGLSLVFWAISGMLMWWQIKPTRLIGAVVIFGISISACVLFVLTFDDLTYSPKNRGKTSSGESHDSGKNAALERPPAKTSQRAID